MSRSSFPCFVFPSLRPSLRALVAVTFVLTALTASADGPAPPAGGTPSAADLQKAHDLGERLAAQDYDAESSAITRPNKDLMNYKFADSMKAHGSNLSDVEREVFTEAYWNEYEQKQDEFGGGMSQIDPPTLLPPVASTTTNVSGKTATPGPGTLQLTDVKGNSYFVDVDANGNYSGTVPQGNFQPIKMTLRTSTLKAAWRFTQNGTWEQVSHSTISASTPSLMPPQNAMAPRSGSPQPQLAQAAAYLDQCQREGLVATSGPEYPTQTDRYRGASRVDFLIPVRLFGAGHPINVPGSKAELRLVDDPLPPEAVREAQRQGIDHADQQFEKSQLEKIKDRTPDQQRRLDDLNRMLKDYDTWKNNQFSNQDAVKVAEDAAKARWLQRQAEALRAGGAPGAEQAAQAIENQARELMGGQTLPPLRASAQDPLQFSSAMTPRSPNLSGSRVVPHGQSGFAIFSASTAGQGAETGTPPKGHSKLVATEQIRQSTSTQIELEPLAHVEEEDSNQTATMYAHFGYDPNKGIGINPNWTIGPTWSQSDAKPPFVAPVDGKGDFPVIGLKDLSKPCLNLNVAYGFNHVSIPMDRNQLGGGGDVNVTVNGNSSWTAGVKTGADIRALKDSYMNEGAINGVNYDWSTWRTPFSEAPVIVNGQISDSGYNRVSWAPSVKNFMVYGELNPGALPDPAPGLHPEDWPHTQADPQPVLVLPGSWLDD